MTMDLVEFVEPGQRSANRLVACVYLALVVSCCGRLDNWRIE